VAGTWTTEVESPVLQELRFLRLDGHAVISVFSSTSKSRGIELLKVRLRDSNYFSYDSSPSELGVFRCTLFINIGV
jgi:hypothetical protein